MRISSSSLSAAQSRIATAARTARSASSSCAAGAPKSAITASPMNFSTVPPKRSSSYRSRSWYGRSIASTSSGSSCSARAVKPTRSAKRTVTTFRSRRAPSMRAESRAALAEREGIGLDSGREAELELPILDLRIRDGRVEPVLGHAEASSRLSVEEDPHRPMSAEDDVHLARVEVEMDRCVSDRDDLLTLDASHSAVRVLVLGEPRGRKIERRVALLDSLAAIAHKVEPFVAEVGLRGQSARGSVVADLCRLGQPDGALGEQ